MNHQCVPSTRSTSEVGWDQQLAETNESQKKNEPTISSNQQNNGNIISSS
jgi:hypothetical protein